MKDTVSYYVGDDVVVKSRSGEDNAVRGVSEAEMRADIKEELNIEVPVFRYKPEEMELKKYEIYDKGSRILIYYSLAREKVVLCIVEGDDDKHDIDAYDGELVDTIQNIDQNLSINIFENLEKESGEKKYSAKWERENANYRLSGIKEKEEFYNLLKKMTF